MGSSCIYSSAHIGLDSIRVSVEADISAGLPKFTIVGLPDTAISESRERVRAAIKNSGFSFPRTRVTVNLAPADIKKQGPCYDLPMAVSLLLAVGVLPKQEILKNSAFVGELALDGSVRPIDGVLLAATMCAENGFSHLFVARENAQEAALVANVRVHAISSLIELVELFVSETEIPRVKPIKIGHSVASSLGYDMKHIKGQEF